MSTDNSRVRTLPFLSLPVVLTLAGLATGPGCTYVGQGLYEEHLAGIDADGDGEKRADDCDDEDADRSHAFAEVPYDGIDNDCDGFDIVDADGDGYPGILQSDWTGQGGVEWPTSVKAEPVDCADDLEAIPEARNIFPGKGSDTPYNGLDEDCAGDNDFDQDGDGDVPPGYEQDVAAYEALWGYSFGNTFGDCDDFDSSAYSGASGEVCADGVNTDCAVDNDYDCDGDGYMPDSVSANTYQAYLNQYFGGVAPAEFGAAAFGDCDDDDPSVHPDATDTPYDGVDSDCGCSENNAWENDYDADGDNWVPPGDMAAADAFAATWCAGIARPAGFGEGDCDDDDAAVNPAALEALGDAVDADCDGGIDTAPFNGADLQWTHPRPPSVTATTGDYVLVTAADYFEQGGIPNTMAGVALVFDGAATANSSYEGLPILWQGQVATDPIGAGVDAIGNDDQFWSATVYNKLGQSYLVAVEYHLSGTSYIRGPTDVFAVPQYDSLDVELALDSQDKPWAWSVGANVVHVLHGDASLDVDDGDDLAIGSGATVIIDTATVGSSMATTCISTGCSSWSYAGTSIAAAVSQPWAAYDAVASTTHGAITVLVDAVSGVIVDDGATSTPLLAGSQVVYAEASEAPNGTLYLAAVVDTGPTTVVQLHYGDVGALPLDSVTLPLDAGLTPTGVSVHATASRVFIGVSAEDGTGDDFVGWTFLSPI